MSEYLPSGPSYPPALTEEELDTLVSHVKDWQINNGSLLKMVRFEEHSTVPARPIAATLFPSPLPRRLFHHALELQPAFNRLYVAAAENEEFLSETLAGLMAVEPLAAKLWEIYKAAKGHGLRQELTLGIFRSDYMLHKPDADASSGEAGLQLKQVELNTYSCAGGTHADKVSKMHHHFRDSGLYDAVVDCERDGRPGAWDMPRNDTVEGITWALAMAHEAYGDSQVNTKGILMVVQPYNINVCDERPLEYALWQRRPAVSTYRVEWGEPLLECCRLGQHGELLFHMARKGGAELVVEVSVVYWRAGYEPEEYDEVGCAGRLLVAQSKAIECPSILSHLTTMKKVQEALGEDEVLRRLCRPEDEGRIRETLMPFYKLTEKQGREIATDRSKAVGYVLKPSLEGGGHNVYKSEIAEYLGSIEEREWGRFVLMKLIEPVKQSNVLVSANGIEQGGEVVSELGIFGACLWRRRGQGMGEAEMVHNCVAGWSLKTKDVSQDEMSVVKGYGCFDSARLV